MASASDLDVAIERIDELLADHPVRHVRVSWRIVRGAARRGKRITARTLPRVAGVAQHAIVVRDAIDKIITALPPTMLTTAATARDHVLAIIDAASTGASSDDGDPSEPD